MEGEELQVIEDGDMEDWLKVTAVLLFVEISGQYQPLWNENIFLFEECLKKVNNPWFKMCSTVYTVYVFQSFIGVSACHVMSLCRCVTQVVRWAMFLSIMRSSCVYQQRTVPSAPPHPLGIERRQGAEVSSLCVYYLQYDWTYQHLLS